MRKYVYQLWLMTTLDEKPCKECRYRKPSILLGTFESIEAINKWREKYEMFRDDLRPFKNKRFTKDIFLFVDEDKKLCLLYEKTEILQGV